MSALPTSPASPSAPPLGLSSLDFGAQTEQHRRELLVHCYRMLGSLEDAEDLVQETLLRAWRRRDTYARRAPLRAWLYKIATNACLDVLAQRPRRSLPTARGEPADPAAPSAPAPTEPIWLEPFPDAWLAPESDNPEAHYTLRESVTLAFLTALHLLTPRQRAVLLLRDVLDWPASEVASALDLSVPAVKSALHRARTLVSRRYQAVRPEALAGQAADPARRALLEQYVQAWEMGDAVALTRLLTADATFSMPPTPDWYRGRDNIRALVSRTVFGGQAAGRWRLRPTTASSQPAFGIYQLDSGEYRAYGIQVVTLTGAAIAGILTFRNPGLVGRFGLPPIRPA